MNLCALQVYVHSAFKCTTYIHRETSNTAQMHRTLNKCFEFTSNPPLFNICINSTSFFTKINN